MKKNTVLPKMGFWPMNTYSKGVLSICLNFTSSWLSYILSNFVSNTSNMSLETHIILLFHVSFPCEDAEVPKGQVIYLQHFMHQAGAKLDFLVKSLLAWQPILGS